MAPPPPTSSLAAAARRLAASILAAAGPCSSWSPAVERALAHHSPRLTPALVAAAIDGHLLPYRSLAAGLFHWAPHHHPSFSHTPQTYHSLLKSLTFPCGRRGGGARDVLALLAQARAARVPLLPATHHLAIAALLSHGRHAEAFALFESLSATTDALLPSPLCNSLVSAVASSAGSLGAARKVFDRMLSRNVEFNDVGLGVFVNRISRTEELHKILDLVETVKKRGDRINGSIIAAVVIDGFCRAGRIEDAWKALEELRMRDCKPDFVAYRMVSEGFRSAGRVEEEMQILKQKRKLGVAPRAGDYKEFILALVSERRLPEAKDLGEAIVLGDFPIEDDVLNVLIGSVSTIDPDAAIMFCKYMIGKERFPSDRMLNYLCRNLCKNEKGEEMWDIFRMLLDRGYCTIASQYHVVVSFLCKCGKVREAYDVLKAMKRKGLDPDISSYNSLMEALCRDNLLRPAKKLWDEMFTSGCSVNLRTYNILITKFSEIGEVEEAWHLFDHMLQKGIVPDAVTYTSIIKMLCQANKFEQAMEIFNKSMEQDVELASLVLNTFILSLCEEGNFRKALQVISFVHPNIDSSNSHVILLKSLTDAGEVDMATEHIKWVRSNYRSTLEKILNELIASLSTAPRFDHVKKLIQSMQSQGLVHEVGPWMNLMRDCA